MKRPVGRPLLIALGILLLLGLLIAAGYIASALWPRVVVIEQKTVDTPRGSITPKPGLQPFDKLVDQVCSAIVTITPGATADEAQPDTAPPALSTGFLISSDGFVVTAAQNLGEAESFDVALRDGRHFTAVRSNRDDLTGIELLAIQRDANGSATSLPFLQFAATSASRIGQWVLSVQSPAGAGCSADLATISADSIVNGDRHGNYLVLRPMLDPSSMGAPLFNVEGRVIGIAGLGAATVGEGSSAALPASLAQLRIDALRHGGQPPASYGLAINDLTPVLAPRFGAGQQSGVYVALVVPGSPADAAGLQVGDIVTKVNGQIVSRAGDVTPLLQPSLPTGIELLRLGQSLTATLSPPKPAGPVRTEKTRESKREPRRR